MGTWFYGDDRDFVAGVREQDPVTVFDISLIHCVRPGFWASINGTFYTGGRSTVDGITNLDYLQNSRIGFSVTYPITPRQLRKLSFTNDIATEFGGDYSSISLSYGYRLK